MARSRSGRSSSSGRRVCRSTSFSESAQPLGQRHPRVWIDCVQRARVVVGRASRASMICSTPTSRRAASSLGRGARPNSADNDPLIRPIATPVLPRRPRRPQERPEADLYAPTADAAEFALDELEEKGGRSTARSSGSGATPGTSSSRSSTMTSRFGASSAARTPSKASMPATGGQYGLVVISPPSRPR
jgi:hypothetical protein